MRMYPEQAVDFISEPLETVRFYAGDACAALAQFPEALGGTVHGFESRVPPTFHASRFGGR